MGEKASSSDWFHPESRWFWLLPVLLWGLIVSLSLAWNFTVMKEQAKKIALYQSEGILGVIREARFRGAIHGGLFVPLAEGSRFGDTVSVHGLRMSRISPALLDRKIDDLVILQKEPLVHVTSLRPVSSTNMPDHWEMVQLQDFERGGTQRIEMVGGGKRRFFRFMAPLRTDVACLNCHAQHGYREGDIRGGVSIAIPAEPIFAMLSTQRKPLLFLHAASFLIVSLLIIFFLSHLRRQWQALQLIRDEQEEIIAVRTASLRATNEELQAENMRRQRAEDEINKLNTDLEKRVAERTVELHSANSELEAFCYSVAHDLRTPLRGINGFSRLLLETQSARLDDEGREYLGRVNKASIRMGRLVDDLLDLSRVTRLDMQRATVDLTSMAQEIAAELQQLDPERLVYFDVSPELQAEGDENLLRLVLVNLLTNAWKFTARHPRARIEVGSLEDAGRTVYFVRDDGVGFDMKYVHKLFGPFQRLVAIDEFEGTGVGLATVKRIVVRHGGDVWAEGAPDQGATFYFTLSPA